MAAERLGTRRPPSYSCGHARRRRHTSRLSVLATPSCVMPLFFLYLLLSFFLSSCIPPVGFAAADVAKNDNDDIDDSCPSYGCPILPLDIQFDKAAQSALASLGGGGGGEVDASVWDILKQSTDIVVDDEDGVSYGTLTLMGHKGSRKEVNQDRALVLSPFVWGESQQQGRTGRLVGVFDGHGHLGETVSQHVVEQLPVLLQKKINAALENNDKDKDIDNDHQDELIKTALIESFIELDKTAPNGENGGCTATAVLQLESRSSSSSSSSSSRVHVANAGDSRALVALHHEGKVKILYATREDKPDLDDERARVEAAGGKVSLPRRSGGTSRVMFQNPYTGQFSGGLAMSRSIGDWQVGKFGVIPDPLVAVLDLEREGQAYCQGRRTTTTEMQVDAATGEVVANEEEEEEDNCQVDFFAVAATDGMLDYLSLELIAQTVAKALYSSSSFAEQEEEQQGHLLTNLEQLIQKAAEGWNREHEGQYRDDIAIAVSKL